MNVELSEIFEDNELALENLVLTSSIFRPCDIFLKNAVNLTYLSLSETEIVTNVMLQKIFQYLTKLRHLQITRCSGELVDDFGFTGESETIESETGEAEAGESETGEQTGESETGEKTVKKTGYTISNLKNLDTLYIRIRASYLGDLTLKHISELKQLKSLNLYCKDVSF